MTRIGALTLVALLALCARAEAAGEPGRFDYYVLTLSWSPTYCETEGRGRNEPQCSGGRPYAFVLHGLWPQYERGWPEDCPTSKRPFVPEALIRDMLDIMPARGLVIHEYRKHGTCSGLTPAEYFAASRRLFESLKIPARYLKPTAPITVSPQQIEDDFIATNAGLDRDMIAVACGRGKRLREVRICYTKDLALRACGPNEEQRKLCALDAIVLPPVR